MVDLTLTVNDKVIRSEIDDRTLLIDFLRDTAKCKSVKPGCYEARCGCCTVLLDGAPAKSCNVLAIQADGLEVRTAESLAPIELIRTRNVTSEAAVALYEPLDTRGVDISQLHPLQRAFHDHGASQCGFCTPGMLMVLVHGLSENPAPSPAEVRQMLRGNLCRCTGYQAIVDAALAAAGTPVKDTQQKERGDGR